MRRPLLAGAVASALAGASCLEPTQVTVALETDIPCTALGGAALWIGATDAGVPATGAEGPSATTVACDGGALGTLVLLPGSAGAASFSVRVAAGVGKPPETCTNGDPKCVWAERRLGYVSHRKLLLPIRLATRCLGVKCPVGETCVEGTCRSANVDPLTCATPTGCDESTLPPGTGTVQDDPSCALVPELAGTAAWPNEGRCPNRAGRTPLLGPSAAAKIAWKLPLETAGSSNDPVIGPDGTIYVTHGRKVVAARPDGTPVFTSADLGGDLPFGAVATRDAVVVASGTDTVTVVALDPRTGATLWSTPLPMQAGATASRGDMLLAPQDVVVLSVETGIFAVSLKTRQVVLGPGLPAMSPSLAPNGTLFATYGDLLRAFTPGNADSKSVAPGLASYLSIGSGRVYVGSPSGLYAYSFDLMTAESNAAYTPGSRAAIAPDGTVFVYANAGRMAALSPDLATTKWTTQPGPGITGSPILDGDGVVYFGTDDPNNGSVQAVDGVTGVPRWKLPVGAGTRSSMALGEGRRLYFVSTANELVCVGPQ